MKPFTIKLRFYNEGFKSINRLCTIVSGGIMLLKRQIDIKKVPKSKKKVLVALLCAFLLTAAAFMFMIFSFSSNEKIELFKGENPIIINGEQAGNAIHIDDSLYIPIAFIKEQLDDSIYYDEPTDSIIIVEGNNTIKIPFQSSSYIVDGEKKDAGLPGFIEKNGASYLPVSLIEEIYDIKVTIMPETEAIWIKRDGESLILGKIVNKDIKEEDARLRIESTHRSPYVSRVSSNEEVYIEGEAEGYYLIRKKSGEAGYIQQSLVKKLETIEVDTGKEIKEVERPIYDEPIHLTWEAVYTKNPKTSSMPDMPGVNILSPTWFELENEKGKVKNLASKEFASWASEEGYKLWGLFSNAFDPDLTHAALQSFDTRKAIIGQLVSFSKQYKMEGINIDIENVNEEDGPLITQFIREASAAFHQEGLIVSMDITFISSSGNWSAFYEREKLAEIVDYLVVMAYDEHWATSPIAGSVASIPWVENNLQQLLEIVPNEQLILGVPLYTRIWEENEAGEISSKAVSMSKVKEWLEDKNAQPRYDADTGQNYAEHYDEEERKLYKVWLEDELSLSKRAELAMDYELAGVATWSRYFADETAWTALKMEDENEEKQ